MRHQIRCDNCLATKWYITQDELLQSIKEMRVKKSRLPFWKQNADGTLHCTVTYIRFQSLYNIISIIYGQIYMMASVHHGNIL